MMKSLVCLVAALLLLMPLSVAAEEDSLDFVVIHPGQPGNPVSAQPVMAAFADYLQDRLADVAIAGRYYNRTEEALTALASEPPHWGIVSLGFFIEEGQSLALKPIASTRPDGEERERLYLLVAADSVDDWRQLEGSVAGTMLFQHRAAARLLLETTPEELPFALEGTFHPLRALRQVLRGELAGVVLDRPQFQALQDLPLFQQLKTIHMSAELPTAPVVWFGKPTEAVQPLVTVLQAMADDPQAAGLLTLLQNQGFGPPDPCLADYWEELP